MRWLHVRHFFFVDDRKTRISWLSLRYVSDKDKQERKKTSTHSPIHAHVACRHICIKCWMLSFKCLSISANQSSMIIYDNSYYVLYEVMMRVCRRHYSTRISTLWLVQVNVCNRMCVCVCLYVSISVLCNDLLQPFLVFICLKFKFSNIFNFIIGIAESKPQWKHEMCKYNCRIVVSLTQPNRTQSMGSMWMVNELILTFTLRTRWIWWIEVAEWKLYQERRYNIIITSHRYML